MNTCPLCGEPITDPDMELCEACHLAFIKDFAPEIIDEDHETV